MQPGTSPDTFALCYATVALGLPGIVSIPGIRTLAADLSLLETFPTTSFAQPKSSEDPQMQAATKALHTHVLQSLQQF